MTSNQKLSAHDTLRALVESMRHDETVVRVTADLGRALLTEFDSKPDETTPPTAPMLTVFWREVIKVADAAGLKKGMGLDVTLGWDLIEAARRAMRSPEEPACTRSHPHEKPNE